MLGEMNLLNKMMQVLNYVFVLLLVYVLYGAIRSPIFSLEKISNVLFVVTLIVLFLFVALFFSKDLEKHFQKMFSKIIYFIEANTTVIVAIILVVLFGLQVIILSQITAPIGWDVLDNFNMVMDPRSEGASFAISVNPNNQFLFFMMYGTNKLINLVDFTGRFANTWLSWQIFNCLFINLAAMFLYLGTKKLFSQLIGFVAFCLFVFSMGLSPWILTPYTDTLVLPFVCGTIYCYSILQTRMKMSLAKKLAWISLCGILLTCCFLMKPSSIIFFVAFCGIKFLKGILSKKTNRLNWLPLIYSLCLLGSILVTYQTFHFFKEHQTIISIDEKQAKPWTLFVMMGLTGTGGYNGEDTKAIYDLPTPQEKSEYTKKVIIQRLKAKGVVGYLKFLSQKNINNTAHGDFSWGWDGTDLVPEKESQNKLQSFLRSLYYPQNLQSANIRFLMHLLYLLTLIGMLYSLKQSDEFYLLAVLRLAFIGMILYLLLFEGGRSRYLIQFLPQMYMLAACGWGYQLQSFAKDYSKSK